MSTKILQPFNLQKWIDENRHILKPPVGNKNLYISAEDFIVMIVAGPNARKDYHFNESEEFFYQLEGDINVRIQEDGKAVDVPIKEGEIFLLPPSIPHSPIRDVASVGLVIERKRREGETRREREREIETTRKREQKGGDLNVEMARFRERERKTY